MNGSFPIRSFAAKKVLHTSSTTPISLTCNMSSAVILSKPLTVFLVDPEGQHVKNGDETKLGAEKLIDERPGPAAVSESHTIRETSDKTTVLRFLRRARYPTIFGTPLVAARLLVQNQCEGDSESWETKTRSVTAFTTLAGRTIVGPRSSSLRPRLAITMPTV